MAAESSSQAANFQASHDDPYADMYKINPSAVRTPSLDSSTGSQGEVSQRDEPSAPGMKQIKINITIDYPENFFRFRSGRGACKRACRGMRSGKERAHRRGRAMVFLFFLMLYVSFIICGAVAWRIRQDNHLHYIKLPLLIIATFSPITDFIGNALIFRVMKREIDPKRPFPHAFALVANVLLLILHFVIFVFALTWTSRDNYYYYGYHGRQYSRSPVIGLVLYSMITMIVIKLILAVLVFLRPKIFDRINCIKHSIRWSGPGYEEVNQDEDKDGKIGPGTVVNHSDEEETPKSSMDRLRMV